jgi:hypothetical protein
MLWDLVFPMGMINYQPTSLDVGGGNLLAGQAVLLKLCNHPDSLKLAKQKREQRKALSKSQQSVAHVEEHPTSANEVSVESEEVEPEEDNEFLDFSWIGNLLDSPRTCYCILSVVLTLLYRV